MIPIRWAADDYLIAKSAICGIESDKDGNGKTIQNSRSKKRLKAINEALPDTAYKLRVVLYEICGIGKSVYEKKKTTKAGIALPEIKAPEIKLPEIKLPEF